MRRLFATPTTLHELLVERISTSTHCAAAKVAGDWLIATFRLVLGIDKVYTAAHCIDHLVLLRYLLWRRLFHIWILLEFIPHKDIVLVQIAIIRVQLELICILLRVLSSIILRVETRQHRFLMVFLPATPYHVKLFYVFDLKQIKNGEDVGAEELMAQVISTIASDMIKSRACLRVNSRILD